MKTLRYLPLILMTLNLSATRGLLARETVALTDGWKFIREEVASDAAFEAWQAVSIPHTWNALDGQDGMAAEPDLPFGYYRGPAWYVKQIEVPETWKGRRVFVRFEAASLVADVYLNGHLLGQHRGGFTAFCYELTNALRVGGVNTLRVRVDNANFDDVAPLSGDFTVEGGLYRPVHLLVTEPVCITPLDHATSGVYLTQRQVDSERAVVSVETKVSNATATDASCVVEVALYDADGKQITNVRTPLSVPPGETASAHSPLRVDRPHLWSGRTDPYLYRVDVKLWRGDRLLDEVEEPLGLRTVRIDPTQGFLLNGRPYALHGVNRHQELAGKGWALSNVDHARDFAMILDLGATAVRLAHYPQSGFVHDLCDRKGLILWQEVPLVNNVSDSVAFDANAKQQLTEMILQGYNHPSLAMWGLYNELRASWIKDNTAAPEPLLRDLQALAKELDPSRPTVAASWSVDPLPMHPIPDNQAFNIYPGWYVGTVDDFASMIEKASNGLGGRNVALSEYGAGASVTQHEEGELHQPEPGGPFHPEEWQTYIHQREWAMARDNPHLWGTFIWVMFDFASDGRNEGSQPGINDKGLVTHDRSVRKDAYFFYQANWSSKPMIHIASRRMSVRHEPKTAVEVFSNCTAVEMRVNGERLDPVNPDDVHAFRWPEVSLRPGVNRIEAIGTDGDVRVRDACEWTLDR